MVIERNFTWKLSDYVGFNAKNIEKLKYRTIEEIYYKPLDKKYKIYMYNMDYCHMKCYNVRNVIKLIAATSIAEMEQISGDDLELKRITNKVKELNSDMEFIERISMIDDSEKIRITELDCAERKGIKNGIISTAKNMLSLNFDIPTVSKVTGLAVNEILALK